MARPSLAGGWERAEPASAAGAGLGLAGVPFRAAQGGRANVPGCVAPTLRPLPAAALLSAFLAAFVLSVCSPVSALRRVCLCQPLRRPTVYLLKNTFIDFIYILHLTASCPLFCLSLRYQSRPVGALSHLCPGPLTLRFGLTGSPPGFSFVCIIHVLLLPIHSFPRAPLKLLRSE